MLNSCANANAGMLTRGAPRHVDYCRRRRSAAVIPYCANEGLVPAKKLRGLSFCSMIASLVKKSELMWCSRPLKQ